MSNKNDQSDKKKLTKEQKAAAKQKLDEIRELLEKDPEFQRFDASITCFETTLNTLLLQLAFMLIHGCFNWKFLLFVFLEAAMMLVYDHLALAIEFPYLKVYSISNEALHLLWLGINFLLLKALYPEILLGITLRTMIRTLCCIPLSIVFTQRCIVMILRFQVEMKNKESEQIDE